MTTVGVKADPLDWTLPLHIPSYSFPNPTPAPFRTVQLASVKEGLYHPRLPTLRQMEMDTSTNKLSDEHCRTTTTCRPADFRRSTTTHFMPPRLSILSVTKTGRDVHRYYTTPEELKITRKDWSDFLNRSPERYNINLPDLPSNKDDVACRGYAVRYLKPEVTASWRYSFRQEPMLDQYAQRPLPANVHARYRNTNPRYSRNIATEAWR